MRRLLQCTTMLCSLAGAAAAQAGPPAELELRPGDAIRIEFRDEPGLNGVFNIDASGEALVPLIGLVAAAGRPFGAVRAEVLARYERELVDPVIRIVPMQRVAVLGEVRNPGLFPVDPTHSVSDVIAAAGGITPTGRTDRIQLVREGTVLNARLEPQSNALASRIRSGDQIIVARRSWLSQNTPFVIGAIGSVVAAAIASIIVN